MTELEKEQLKEEIKSLFPDGKEFVYNDLRMYSMYTIAKDSDITIGFDIEDDIVNYMLVKGNT